MTGQQGSAAAIAVYDDHAPRLADRYDAIPNDRLYAPVRHLIPSRPARVADIGAGTGRDARWFAGMGHRVTAVEPVSGFLEPARATDDRIEWLQDALPRLPRLMAQGGAFDFVNLMGVWHHLDTRERALTAPILRHLTAPRGLICLALRQGPLPLGLPVHEIDPDETADLFANEGFDELFRTVTDSIGGWNRAAGVTWVWLVLQAPGESDAE